jgi:membrane-associated phospholipid phosphatase
MRALALIAFLALAAACSNAPETQGVPDYWLFSWVMRDGTYRFTVVRESERRAFVLGFRPSFPGHGAMAQAEAALRGLPKGVLVGWGDASCAGLTYPPREMMRSIAQFATDHQVNLRILPGQCEER